MTAVDVIVPVYGGIKHLRKLIPALEATITPEQATVWFVDDCTPPDKDADEIIALIAAASARSEMFKYARTPKNSGFSGANNYGATLGKAEYICLLNSDTEPQAGWLKHMTAILDELPQVGIVGAKLLFPEWSKDPSRPAGKIQHAGVAFDTSRMPYHLFLGWPADHPKVNRRLHMKAVTGACLLCRRSAFEKVGGLNTLYGQGNFEDIEFCLAVSVAGYETVYCPDAVLWHWGSGSNNTNDAEKNALVFSSRWSHQIDSDDWLYW